MAWIPVRFHCRYFVILSNGHCSHVTDTQMKDQLESVNSVKFILPPEDVDKMFPLIDSLYKLHNDTLLPAFMLALHNWYDHLQKYRHICAAVRVIIRIHHNMSQKLYMATDVYLSIEILSTDQTQPLICDYRVQLFLRQIIVSLFHLTFNKMEPITFLAIVEFSRLFLAIQLSAT